MSQLDRIESLVNQLANDVAHIKAQFGPRAPAPHYADGTDLKSSHGNWLLNTIGGELGVARFWFDVREGQKHVEVTLAEPTSVGDQGHAYMSVKLGKGDTAIAGVYEGRFQRSAKIAEFLAWPYGAGRFWVDVGMDRKMHTQVQYNHD